MSHLVVENGNLRGQRMELAAGQRLILGRDPQAQLSVEDRLCSREHCAIEYDGTTAIVRDLGSSNGTYVNDERIEAQVLQNGDTIRAGETQLTFLSGEGSLARGLIGKTVGGYRILERIGRGGMGTVYKANQVSLDRVVALKILSPKVAADPAFVRKFQEEARAAGALNHQNIVQVYDVGSDRDLHFYSMEFIENGSVQDLATREGALEIGLCLEVILDAARGLEYAEKRQIVHRDIKPDNLMINAEGIVKIADLGLARDAGRTARDGAEPHADDEGIFGTPHFIAPEQAMGQKVDTRSDIYSLGASFYRLVTGETPFKGDSVREIIQAQIRELPVPVRERRKDCPLAVAALIEKMMRKDPDARPQSASALVAELERLRQALERPAAKRLLPIAIGAVLVLCAVVGVVLFGGSQDKGKTQSDPDPVRKASRAEDPKDEAARIALERQAKLLAFQNALQLLKNEELAANPKTADELKTWIANYDRLQTEHAEVPEASEQIERFRGPLSQRRAELVAEAERQAAEEAARATAATAAVKEILDQAKAKEVEGQPVAALVVLLDGMDARALERRPERAQIDQAFETALAALRQRTTEALATANQALSGGDPEAAEEALSGCRKLLQAGLAGPDARLAEVSGMEKQLANRQKEIVLAAEKLRRETLTADRLRFLLARRAAQESLRKTFDPKAARELFDQRLGVMNSLEFQELATMDRALLQKAEGLTAAVAALWNKAKAPKELDLPSAADNAKLVAWKVREISASGLSLQRSRFQRDAVWTEFGLADFWTLFVQRIAETDAGIRREAAELLLWAGEPDLAEAALPPTAEAAVRERFAAESKAWRDLAAIRALESKAESDDSAWLKMLPLINRFLEEHRQSLAFSCASNGSSPMFVAPEDP